MRKVIVNFSGGKDSTVAILEAMKKYPKEELLLCFQDTGAEFDGTREHVIKVAQMLDLPLEILEPQRDWFEQIRHDNFPFTPTLRKCTWRLKIDIFHTWISRNRKELGDEIIIVSGVRGEESLSRSKMTEWERYAHRPDWYWKPCLNMPKKEIFERIRSEGLPIHYCYEFSDRCNCWLCIFADFWAVQEYARLHPDDYEKACLLEDEIKKPLMQGYKIKVLFAFGVSLILSSTKNISGGFKKWLRHQSVLQNFTWLSGSWVL